MKKLILLTLIVLGTVSFARGGSGRDSFGDVGPGDSLRDYEYNERRDIVIPMEENVERLSRFSPYELEIEMIAAEENIEKYPEFHRDLDRSDMGENSDR